MWRSNAHDGSEMIVPDAPDLPTVGWVAPFTLAGGMDHLGIQVIGEQIYSDLLPGITNVTDRLWNYAFYPWFTWAYEQEGLEPGAEAFSAALRRAEVLNTLVAAVHEVENGHDSGEDPFVHGGGLVGRQKLVGVARQIVEGRTISIDEFAPNDAPRRYFANQRGGLGQYYLGALRGLKLLKWDPHSGAEISDARGEKLAEAFDGHVNRALFFECLQSPSLELSKARDLAGFCPCHLGEMADVRQLLEDMLFNSRQGLFHEADSDRRRETLLLLLASAAHTPEDAEPEEPLRASWGFREAAYSGVWRDQRPVVLPNSFQEALGHWEAYQRHELLSIALNALFWAGLYALGEGNQSIESPQAFGDWFLVRFKGAIREVGDPKTGIGDVLSDLAKLKPDLSAFEDPLHELAKAHQMVQNAEDGEAEETVKHALSILLSLLARRSDKDPYEGFPFALDYFRDYPLNLQSFFDSHDPGRPFGVWVRGLVVDWGICAHLRVAFRKLHREGLDTFKIRPGEDRYWCLGQREIPVPTWTTPRLGQAIRMLHDLCLLDRGLLPTSEGLALLAREGLHV